MKRLQSNYLCKNKKSIDFVKMAEKKQVLISTEYASSPVSELSTNKFKSLTSNGISHTATFIMPNFSDLDENQLGEGHASSFGVNTPLTADILKPNLGCQIMLFPVKPLDKDG